MRVFWVTYGAVRMPGFVGFAPPGSLASAGFGWFSKALEGHVLWVFANGDSHDCGTGAHNCN